MSSICAHSDVVRIYLTGFMGSGKTTVGRSLAAALGWNFVDLDHVIEERVGTSIACIFKDKGEAEFRSMETAALQEILTRSRVVVSTGGGIVVNPANRRFMRDSGLVVNLAVHADEVMRRLAGDTSRPLLSGEDRSAKITALLKGRLQAYEDADKVIETDGRSPQEITQDILTWIKTR